MNIVSLMSGGPDALTATKLAMQSTANLGTTSTVFVDYGQHTRDRERRSARLVSEWLGSTHFEVSTDIYQVVGGAQMVDQDKQSLAHDPTTEYVPFRNSVFLTMAVALAECVDAERVVIGSIAGNQVTPDNSPQYLTAFQTLTSIGTLSPRKIQIIAPLQSYDKRAAIETALNLGLPLGDTWSCHNQDDIPCGRCSNCLMRDAAFASLGRTDPIAAL